MYTLHIFCAPLLLFLYSESKIITERLKSVLHYCAHLRRDLLRKYRWLDVLLVHFSIWIALVGVWGVFKSIMIITFVAFAHEG